MAKTLTILDFFRRFPNDAACLAHLFTLRYGNDFGCPKCGVIGTFRKLSKQPAYTCNCGHHVHPMQGTIFQDTHTPLTKWFYALYLFTTTRHGVPAKELQRQLGVSYPTAFRMAHLIRQHMARTDGEIRPNQCEVTYVNTISLAKGADPHREVSRVMTIANAWPGAGGDLPVLENTTIKSQAILSRDGEPTCRLYLVLQPVINTSTGQNAIRLELTARGKPNGDGVHEAFELIDFAHCGVVNTFTAVTTDEMHRIWGLKNG